MLAACVSASFMPTSLELLQAYPLKVYKERTLIPLSWKSINSTELKEGGDKFLL